MTRLNYAVSRLFHSIRIPLDEHTRAAQAAIGNVLSNREMAYFYGKFLEMAKHRNIISILQFYSYIEEHRTVLGDAIFDVLAIDATAGLSFGHFLHVIITMAMMDREEVLKMIFFVFDKDKNGFISKAEMDQLVEVCKVISSSKTELIVSEVGAPNDGLLEFDELCNIIHSNNILHYASSSLQNKIMARFKGHQFWHEKKILLNHVKNKDALEKKQRDIQCQKVVLRCKHRQLRRKMGYFAYYFAKLQGGISNDKIIGESYADDQNGTQQLILNETLKEENAVPKSKNDDHIKLESIETETNISTNVDEILSNVEKAYKNSGCKGRSLSHNAILPASYDINFRANEQENIHIYICPDTRKIRLANRRANRSLLELFK